MRWNASFSRLSACTAFLLLNKGRALTTSTATTTSTTGMRFLASARRHSSWCMLSRRDVSCKATSDHSESLSSSSEESSSLTTPGGPRRRDFQLLDERIRLRGPVDRGYGRGGKKLGFPTANLPSSLFQNALADVTNGVYFGWALVENNQSTNEQSAIPGKRGRNVPHKAVVNVGFSPTFEGAENKEKIVEAHLIFAHNSDSNDSPLLMDPPDFYNETMRLQLDAFLRPEKKFPSFPDLLAQITADVEDAKAALDEKPFIDFLRDSHDFLQAHDGDAPWVGSGGGDEHASWEKIPIKKE